MATNLKIDSDLLEEAKRIGPFRTKKAAVNQALKEFIEHRKQLDILEWEGKVDFSRITTTKRCANSYEGGRGYFGVVTVSEAQRTERIPIGRHTSSID